MKQFILDYAASIILITGIIFTIVAGSFFGFTGHYISMGIQIGWFVFLARRTYRSLRLARSVRYMRICNERLEKLIRSKNIPNINLIMFNEDQFAAAAKDAERWLNK